MLLSGLCCFIDNVAWVLLSNDADLMAIFSLIIFVLADIAELAFVLSLVVRGKEIVERMS